MNKHTILLLLLPFAFSAFAQKKNPFIVKGNEVEYQKVYNTGLSFENFLQNVRLSGKLQDITVDGHIITGELRPFDLDILGAGYTQLDASAYFTDNFITSFVILEWRDNRYRVTMKKIMLGRRTSSDYYEYAEKMRIEYQILSRKNEFTKRFISTDLRLLKYNFNRLFDFNQEEVSADW